MSVRRLPSGHHLPPWPWNGFRGFLLKTALGFAFKWALRIVWRAFWGAEDVPEAFVAIAIVGVVILAVVIAQALILLSHLIAMFLFLAFLIAVGVIVVKWLEG